MFTGPSSPSLVPRPRMPPGEKRSGEQSRALAQEIRLGSPDRFSSWEGGVWGRD